jgi:lambda family phage portal protein
MNDREALEQLLGANRPQSAFFRAGGGQIYFSTWHPALREPRDDVRAVWTVAAARAVEAVQNSGWLAGAVNKAVAAVVGTGLKLKAAPDMEELGWTADQASQWARKVEKRWRAWSNNPYACDAQGRMSIGHMMGAAYRSWLGFGEILALLPMIRRNGVASRTKVLLLPPSRLSQKTEDPYIFQGVRLDRDGLPIGHVLKRKRAWEGEEEIEIRARDADGRPQVVHVFDGAAGQVRGITPLAPTLKVIRQYDQLADATLTNTLLQTIFAGTITSEAMGESVYDGLNPAIRKVATGENGSPLDAYFGDKAAWYSSTQIDLGAHGRLAHLFPGDKLEFHGSKSPNDNYECFAKGLLREMAMGIGVTYEDATGDYTQATYSSVRMATNAIWGLAMYRRQHLIVPFATAIYEAWLEEEIGEGRIGFPGGLDGFLARRDAAVRAEWHGPSRPTADDLKTAKAQETRLKNGVSTLASEAGEAGQDWEDMLEQLEREVEAFTARGLKHPFTVPTVGKPDRNNGAEQKEDEQ